MPVARSRAEPTSREPANARLARVARALAVREASVAERDEPFKEPAVALVLRAREDGDSDLLLIRRATRVGDPWSGQIGLPGGNRAPVDATLEETALRETGEELSLDLRAHATRLGTLDELRPRIPTLPPIIVRPFVWSLESADLALVMSDEVAEYRWIALAELFAPATRVQVSVEARNIRLKVEALQVGEFTIWGMTERILSSLQAIIA
jgi:8-oxo-dGTP pyrophosphatase MutT (NUDIX family)